MLRFTTIQAAIVFGGAAIIIGLITALIFWPVPEPAAIIEPEVEAEPELVVYAMSSTTIGNSVTGRPIEAYSFGDGDTTLLFVGGIHGGYEWNTSLLAYEMIDHLITNPELIPDNQTVTIIPNLNPDGTALVTGKDGVFTISDITDPSTRLADGRFNANGVDLNRNFDCRWAPESTWRGAVVSAGSAAFSEPEAAALRDWVAVNQPTAAVFWHSIGNAVFESECGEGVLPGTTVLMNTYAGASGYEAAGLWTAYPVTGDAEGWLASIGIPAVTVELEAAASIEWGRNLAGTMAILEQYKAGE